MPTRRALLLPAAVLAVVMAAACGPRESGAPKGPTAPPPQGKNNLVVDMQSANLSRLAIEVRSSEWTPLKYDIKASEGRALGGIFVPPGGLREIAVTAFDAKGVETHRGLDQRVFAETMSALSILLQPAAGGTEMVMSLAGQRLELQRTSQERGVSQFEPHVFDPDGQPLKPPFDIRYSLNDVRDYRLTPLRDGKLEVRTPSGGAEIICRLDVSVTACLPGVSCTSIPVCRDPWVTISAGSDHTCGITQSGGLFCWGRNADGQLGYATPSTCGTGQYAFPCSTSPRFVPCPPGAACQFRFVAAGAVRTCAIDGNQDVWCWGFGSITPVKLQAQLAGARVKFQSVAVGFAHVCAISDRNDVWCSGENFFGQIGLPRATQQIPLAAPQRVLVPLRFKQVVAGINHTCVVTTDGTSMACFGDNRQGQLKSTPQTPFTPDTGCSCSSQPVWQPVGGGVTIETADAGPGGTCAKRSTGETACWGLDISLLGLPNTLPATRLAVGGVHMCALVNQAAQCVGNGFFGQMGDNANVFRTTAAPVTVPPATYTVISAGGAHTCGITPNGEAWCWGNNAAGQLGLGTTALAVRVPTKLAQ